MVSRSAVSVRCMPRTPWLVAHWLRGFHHAVAEFVPPAGAVGRMGGQWAPGLIIGHNDATGCAGEQLCNIKER